ncbi:hypothetical protein D3C72_1650640 [compost metagenome]
MIQKALGKKLSLALHNPRFRLQRAIHHARDPRMHDQPGAHAARLQRDVQRTARQTIVADGLGGGADGDHLGMGARVVAADRAIEAATDDFTVLHQHRAHRHFAEGRALGRQCQGLTHEFAITAAVDDGGGTNLTHHATSIAAIRPVSM